MINATTIAWIVIGQLGASAPPPAPLPNREPVPPHLLAANEVRESGPSRRVVGTREADPRGAVKAEHAKAPAKTVAADANVPQWMKESQQETAGLGQPMNLSGLAFRMFIATVGVLVAAGTSLYLGRQWLEKRQPQEPGGDQIRIVETRVLTPRASVKLIDAAGQMVLVAMDARGIQGLVPLTSTFDDVWEEAESNADPATTVSENVVATGEARKPLRPLATR